MSYTLSAQVWQLHLSPTEQHVLLALASYADDHGRNCFPSQPRLAYQTGLHESTIVRTLKKLLARGIITLLRPATNRSPARYQIHIDQAHAKPAYAPPDCGDSTLLPQDDSRDSTLLPPDIQPDPQGWHSATSRDSTVQSRGSTVLPDPVINQSFNQLEKESDLFAETEQLPQAAEPEPEPETTPHHHTWNACKAELAHMLPRTTYEQWVSDCKLLDASDDRFTVSIPNPHTLAWLQQRLTPTVRRTLSSMLHRPITVDFVIQT